MVYHAPHRWSTSGAKVTQTPPQSTLATQTQPHLPRTIPTMLRGGGLALTVSDGVVLGSAGGFTGACRHPGIACTAAATNKIATALVPPTEACVD